MLRSTILFALLGLVLSTSGLRADDSDLELTQSLSGLTGIVGGGDPKKLEIMSVELAVSGGVLLMGGVAASGAAEAAEMGGTSGISGGLVAATLLRVAGAVGIYCTLMQSNPKYSCMGTAGSVDDTITGHYFSTMDRIKENFFALSHEKQLELARTTPELKKRIIALWKLVSAKLNPKVRIFTQPENTDRNGKAGSPTKVEPESHPTSVNRS